MTLQESQSANVECYTPDEALAFVRAVLGGPPDLDPCADPRRRVGAKVSYTKEDDGLSRIWQGETVFINPPHGQPLPRWVKYGKEQMHDPGRVVRQAQLWLVPSRTDTGWMHDLLDTHRTEVLICDVRGRYRFLNEDYGPFIDAKTGKESHPKFPNRWVLRMAPRGLIRTPWSDGIVCRFTNYGSEIGKVFRLA